MRFVSKNSNLRIVLEPGLSAQPLSGFQGKQPVYIKFENGVVEIKDENLIQKMLQHRAYTKDGDFIAVGDDGLDPFVDRREEIEPTHIHTEIKYGHVEQSTSSPMRKTKVNPELKKIVNDLAMKQIQDLLPGLVADGVKKVLATIQAEAKASSIVVPAPIEEVEEDYSELTVADFAAEDTSDESVIIGTDFSDETVSENGVKMEDLSPEAAAAASTIIGDKEKTPKPKK